MVSDKEPSDETDALSGMVLTTKSGMELHTTQSKSLASALVGLSAGIAKTTLSGEKLVDTVTALVQGTVKGGLLSGFGDALSYLYEQGKLPSEVHEDKEFARCTNSLFQTLNEDRFIAERFELAQEIFLGACTEGSEKLNSPVVQELMRIAGNLSKAGITLFRAASIVQTEADDEINSLDSVGGVVASGRWRETALKTSGLRYHELFEPAINEIQQAGLLKSMEWRKGTQSSDGLVLTDMGREAARLLEVYSKSLN